MPQSEILVQCCNTDPKIKDILSVEIGLSHSDVEFFVHISLQALSDSGERNELCITGA